VHNFSIDDPADTGEMEEEPFDRPRASVLRVMKVVEPQFKKSIIQGGTAFQHAPEQTARLFRGVFSNLK
jgi:hypothetical protein